MHVSISETDFENYVKDRALLIKNLFTPNEVSDLREGIDANISHRSSRAKVASNESDLGWFFEDYCNWQENSAFQRKIFESDILEVAAKLICSEQVRLFLDHMMIKKYL